MELIKNSAEHYFLIQLEEMREKASHWHCLYFSLSKALSHQDLVSDLKKVSDKIGAARARTDVFAEELQGYLDGEFEGSVCVFSDCDVFAFVHITDPEKLTQLNKIFKTLSAKLSKGFADMDNLSSQFRSYQKLADRKLLSVKRFDAYEVLADTHKIVSLSARRKRRDEPLIMMVEDDRFTAHYTSSILSNEFDLIICRDGEDAVMNYIEKVPDIVFLDIHLPGVTGHEVLEAINAADPDAFVVMLSVDSARDSIISANQKGARKFIKKPFSKERLIETVKSSPFVRELIRSERMSSDQVFH